MRTIGLEPITVLDVILSHKRIPFRQVRILHEPSYKCRASEASADAPLGCEADSDFAARDDRESDTFISVERAKAAVERCVSTLRSTSA